MKTNRRGIIYVISILAFGGVLLIAYKTMNQRTCTDPQLECLVSLQAALAAIQSFEKDTGHYPQALEEPFTPQNIPECPITHKPYFYLIYHDRIANRSFPVIADSIPHNGYHVVIFDDGKDVRVPTTEFETFCTRLREGVSPNKALKQ